MTPKSEKPRNANFSMRIDPELRDKLVAVVGESKGGRAGGMSLLFHQLGYLFLGLELPPQRWSPERGADLLDELEWGLEEAESKVSRGESLSEEDLTRLRYQKSALLIMARTLPDPSYERLRGLTLLGRWDLFWSGLE